MNLLQVTPFVYSWSILHDDCAHNINARINGLCPRSVMPDSKGKIHLNSTVLKVFKVMLLTKLVIVTNITSNNCFHIS